MKTRLLLAVLCGSLFFTMSGQTVSTSFAQDINNRFSLLEKNRVPHHILLDYGFDIIDATKFDGVLRSDNYMTIGTFNELFKTIVSSATSTSASGLSSPNTVLQEWATLQKNDHKKTRLSFKASVVLNGLLFNYSRFDPNALNNNKIQITNGKYDDKLYQRGMAEPLSHGNNLRRNFPCFVYQFGQCGSKASYNFMAQ